ncbi:MAG: hypothetical protein WAZ18_03865 [Alphaproteobacteria bacterium]
MENNFQAGYKKFDSSTYLGRLRLKHLTTMMSVGDFFNNPVKVLGPFQHNTESPFMKGLTSALRDNLPPTTSIILIGQRRMQRTGGNFSSTQTTWACDTSVVLAPDTVSFVDMQIGSK